MKPTPTPATVRFTTRGRVVIPRRLRQKFHLEDGTRASVTGTPEGILLQPMTRHSINRLRGILKRKPDVIIISCAALAAAPRAKSHAEMLSDAARITDESFESVGVVNIQCKTNWNDNAQIPMRWNMLYNQARKGAVIPNGFRLAGTVTV